MVERYVIDLNDQRGDDNTFQLEKINIDQYSDVGYVLSLHS